MLTGHGQKEEIESSASKGRASNRIPTANLHLNFWKMWVQYGAVSCELSCYLYRWFGQVPGLEDLSPLWLRSWKWLQHWRQPWKASRRRQSRTVLAEAAENGFSRQNLRKESDGVLPRMSGMPMLAIWMLHDVASIAWVYCWSFDLSSRVGIAVEPHSWHSFLADPGRSCSRTRQRARRTTARLAGPDQQYTSIISSFTMFYRRMCCLL